MLKNLSNYSGDDEYGDVYKKFHLQICTDMIIDYLIIIL